jgi:hypothetical protein
MRAIFSIRTEPLVAMREKHQALGLAGATATTTPLFLSLSARVNVPLLTLLNKLLLITDTIVPSTASDGKTVPASPPFFLELQQGEQTL